MSTVLCLHGFTGHPSAWDAVVKGLPPSVGILRPALTGHDPDAWDPAAAPSTFDDEVDRLARWISARTDEPVHLVGYSMGGRVGLGLLVRHRHLVHRATLIGCHPGLESDAERVERRAQDAALARRLDIEGLEAFVEFWQNVPLFATQRRLPAEVLDRQRRRRLAHRPEGLAWALRTLGPASMPNFWPRLGEFDLPVRLAVGEHDTKYRRIAERMARQLPRAHVEIVPGVGHNPILEAPGAVAQFLDAE